MYDKTPVYPHQQHLLWAHEPLKSVYVFQRLFMTLLLVPLWAVYYLILPRSFRPRPSWSIIQIVVVKFTRRINRVTEVAGVTWGTRDPTQEPQPNSLKETRFAWVPPLPHELCSGIVDDHLVTCQRVGTFIWPKDPSPQVQMRRVLKNGGSAAAPPQNLYCPEDAAASVPALIILSDDNLGCSTTAATSTPASQYSTSCSIDIEADAANHPSRVIGIYLHGGGYSHMSAHENSSTSRIPRRLIKDKLFEEIHAVEYRLLQHAPVPGALQDAAAVYAHLVTHHLGARKGQDGKYHYPDGPADDALVNERTAPPNAPTSIPSIGQTLNSETRPRNHAVPPSKGQFSGRMIVRTFWNRWLVETTLRRIRFNQSDAVAAASRPRIILIGDSAGGNLVLALARWIRDEGVLPVPDGMLLLSPSCDPSHTLPQTPASRRPRPHAETDYLLDTPEPRALLSRTFLGHHPIEMVYSPYISPASELVISAFHGQDDGMVDLEPLGPHKDSRDYRDEGIKAYDCAVGKFVLGAKGCSEAASHPFVSAPRGMGLFTDFPRALIVVGDAERLEREVAALERALEHDGVRVRMVWAKDAVHDILIMGAWDERIREGIWKEIGQWVREIAVE
ncbi:hypothetical protein BGW80DRAFT_1458832 [Lactifluus volemus]|nr:hypothetical protein BGW80DRAFT_1458832 [Lactifluus volemus]